MSNTEAVHYVENENGGVHSVTTDHLQTYLQTEPSPAGKRYLLPGWSELTEKQARAKHPQLFGAPDPSIRLNAKERAEAEAQQEYVDKANARAAAVAADTEE